MSKTVDMWRLRVARGTANSGGGDWTFYESREALENALFRAAVEAEAFTQVRGDNRRKSWFKTWWKGQGGEDDGKWKTQRIVGVDHLVGDEWVEMEWSITPPVLTLEAASSGE